MLEDRVDARVGMSRSAPSPPLPRRKSHCNTAPSAVQDRHWSSLPHLAELRPPHDAALHDVQDHRYGSLPFLGKPRRPPHDAALQDRRYGTATKDTAAARMDRNGLSAPEPTLDVAGSDMTQDHRWSRHFPMRPRPRPKPRWGNLESLLAILLLSVFLLVLPLLLPHLPQPPAVLLLVPLAVMAGSLLVLAFLPSDFRPATASSYI